MKTLIPCKNLISSRLERGLTQDQLAEKAKLSRGMLSNIERGYTLPSLRTAYRLAKVLKRPIEYLFFDNDAQKMNNEQSA